MPNDQLTAEEKERYTRHLIIDEIGEEGQLRIKQASVLVVGTGGLGSPASYYLAAAGIGKLGIVDSDTVSLSNLNRQILHRTSDMERPKVVSAYEKLSDLNPNVEIIKYNIRVKKDNIAELIKDYDVVVDGTDNFVTRFVINDACVEARKPYVFGAIKKFMGQVTLILPGQGPCFRCLFPEAPVEDINTGKKPIGVFSPVPGVIGALEATEALKYILGVGENLVGRLLLYDALNMEFREIIVEPNPDCPVCGHWDDLTENL